MAKASTPLKKVGEKENPSQAASATAGADDKKSDDGATTQDAQKSAPKENPSGDGGPVSPDQKQVSDEELAAAMAEPNKTKTPTEKELDGVDKVEKAAEELAEKSRTMKEEMAQKQLDPDDITGMADLRLVSKLEQARRHANKVGDETQLRLIESIEKVTALVDSWPEDTEDEHSVYGYGGRKLYVGDLRNIVAAFK